MRYSSLIFHIVLVIIRNSGYCRVTTPISVLNSNLTTVSIQIQSEGHESIDDIDKDWKKLCVEESNRQLVYEGHHILVICTFIGQLVSSYHRCHYSHCNTV